ncbi:hypothetical protein FRB95_006460 [Tulasnella sp. JGI-2019a]|nr:hypothetical protein FRB93_009113 [Tulasnella sp. JGI-2019a]KAG9037207.1 hypothetical protein FRB95_006460 [Tulasnella sp. JGI-2019a]
MTTTGLVIAYGGLLTLATAIIYSGAYASLKPTSKPAKSSTSPGDEEESDSDDERESEVIDSAMALAYPIIGSVMLLTLYLALKYIGPEIFNLFLSAVFGFTGVGSVYATSTALAKALVSDSHPKTPRYNIILKKGSQDLVSCKFSVTSLALIPVSFIPAIAYFTLRGRDPLLAAMSTVVLSISFAFNALKQLKLDSFRTGTYLLAGLFFYDVWWVFGTDVMVSVATKADLPIKLLWPKRLYVTSSKDFVMLGLGDVVIPGLFIALALRYDQAKFLKALSTPPSKTERTRFSAPYFKASIVSYVLGLVLTMSVMHFTKHPQPALLYLSPACVLSFVLVAIARGELVQAWKWQEEDWGTGTKIEIEIEHEGDIPAVSTSLPGGMGGKTVCPTMNDSGPLHANGAASVDGTSRSD